jgi:tetratricopeptide (TPR) repeat protein
MNGFSARDVATMLGLSVAQVRSFASTASLSAGRGDRGEYRFSFQDLVLLRAAKELSDARISPRKIKRSLERLREQLPTDQPMTAVRISADGDRVVARDGESLWHPESGQALFDFSIAELEAKVAAFREPEKDSTDEADAWYEAGCDLEADDREAAIEAYRKALAIDSKHADAHVNLGRLLHDEDARAAERHYREAIASDSAHATAHFNLGVVLEDLERIDEARAAYQQAIAIDPDCADAHYNLAGILEAEGKRGDALHHLKEYKRLVG